MGFEDLYTRLNKFVTEVESDDIEIFKIESEQAQLAAERCGCPNCISYAMVALGRFLSEVNRVHPEPRAIQPYNSHRGRSKGQ